MRRAVGSHLPIACVILLSPAWCAATDRAHDGFTGNPYGIAGYISSTNLQNFGFPAGTHTYDWNNLREDLIYEMVRPFHYWYRYFVPGGDYVQDWVTYDAQNQPEEWFTQESYPTSTPWNVRRGCNMILRRYWGYYLDRTGGNYVGQIGLPAGILPQWYIDQGGNHQQRFDAWVTANPDKIWLMGNEPGGPETVAELKGQDALTDREYAVFYHTYTSHIALLDSQALFANAAMAMTTTPTWDPVLPVESVITTWERILGIYAVEYGQEMPVDVWNIHIYAGHGCTDPATHRAEFVSVIETFRDFVDTTRGAIYQDTPLILTEFNGTYDASGFTQENVVNFLHDFRDDLNDLWDRGLLDHWFWFVSNGGTGWPAVSILEGGNLSIVGEEYKDAAWYWEDLRPPRPDPVTWVAAPVATGMTSIAMTATTAFDGNGVEYYFTCTSGGGNDSGWQSSPSYEDTGLQPDTAYAYTVTARDLGPNQNETVASAAAFASTEALPSIDKSTALLTPGVLEGQDAPSQSFQVSNSGGWILNYTITDDADWLTCSPTSGTSTGESDTITVTYTTSELAPGPHHATITISDPGADNNPQTIDVNLMVIELPPKPLLVSAMSRKTHGPAGDRDIDVGIGSTECRSSQMGTGNPNELLIVATFDIDIGLLGDGEEVVSTDAGTVASAFQTDSKELTLVITDLPFAAQVNLTFPGVLNGWRMHPGSASPSTLCVRVIVGDYDNLGEPNFLDFSEVKSAGYLNELVDSVDAARADFDCSGWPDFLDFTKVRNAGLINETAPGCAPPIGP
jgi:hypothetical protein